MRNFLVAAIVLVALIAGAAAALLLMPLDTFRAPLEQTVSRGVGRGIHIAGPMHVSLYPEIGLSADDVSIDNVPGGEAKEFAHVGTLSVGAKLMPLFSHEIDITRLALSGPKIHLEVDSAGNANWNFHFSRKDDASSSTKSRLSIAGLRISDGEITYFDARTGKHRILSQANASLNLAALDQPALFDLDAVYDSDKFTVTGRVDSPDSYVQKKPTKVLLDLTSRLLNLHFDGVVIGTTEDSGTVKLSGPSLRELMRGVGAVASSGTGPGAFSLAGGVSSKDRVYALKTARISLDNMKASVDLTVDTKAKIPAITGHITLDRLDAGAYMAGKDADAARTSGWSTKKLALDGLKLADADVDIAVGTLSVGNFAISNGRMNLGLHDGALTADITQASLFGGGVTGRVSADARGSVPKFGVKFNVKSVAMAALLHSAMKVDRISGTGALAVDVTGLGSNQLAIMNSLGGTASVLVKDGAIRGVDLAAVSRSVQNVLSGALGAATSEKASTDFAEAGGTFKILNGVMHNQDFHLLNPFMRVTGTGDINLGPRTLAFRVEPKLVATREGQGGARDATGISVPFFISGPWLKPSYRPDMKALGASILNQVTNGGGGGIGGILGNALGSRGNGTSASGSNSRQQPSGFNLNGLLGR